MQVSTRRNFVKYLLGLLGTYIAACKPIKKKTILTRFATEPPGDENEDGKEVDSEETSNKNISSETSGANAPSRVRKNIWELNSESPDIVYLTAAIEVMKKIAPDDPAYGNIGWKGISEQHRKACPHGNHFFLPWHRVYLYYFENTVDYFAKQLRAHLRGESVENLIFAKGVPVPALSKEHATLLVDIEHDFALPYWDWSFPDKGNGEDIRIMDIVSENPILDGTRWDDPVIERNIPPEPMDPSWASKSAIAKIVEIDSFHVFTSGEASGQRKGTERAYGELEGAPHNHAHNYIGGTMAHVPVSALDPIFWMHHCNLDRVWETWMQFHKFEPTIVEPESDAEGWKNYELYTFFDLDNQPKTHTVASVLNLRKMDFLGKAVKYDQLAVPITQNLVEIPRPRKSSTPILVDSNLISVILDESNHTLSLQLSAGAEKEQLLQRIRHFKDSSRRLAIAFKGFPEPPEAMPYDHLKFYMQFGPADAERHHIASYGFFGTHQESINMSFELSSKLQDIANSQAFVGRGGIQQITDVVFYVALFKSAPRGQRAQSYVPFANISPADLERFKTMRIELR
ncbi:MAG: tyrosinase family protein [Oligoflexales bacterium]